MRNYRMWKSTVARFAFAAFVFLSACSAPSSSEAAPTVLQDTATTEATVEPSSTPEPVATVAEEFPSPDQEWLLNEVFPKVREGGCEPTWEASYDAFDKYVNSIVWTVDADGNPLQGLVALDFCAPEEPEDGIHHYLYFSTIGDGMPVESVEAQLAEPSLEGQKYLIGPTFMITYQGTLPGEGLPKHQYFVVPEWQLGFLSSEEELSGMRTQFNCAKGWLEQLGIDHTKFYQYLYLETSFSVGKVFGEKIQTSSPVSIDDFLRCYGQ